MNFDDDEKEAIEGCSRPMVLSGIEKKNNVTKYEFELNDDIPKGWGKRHTQFLLGSVCVGIAYMIKVNLSIAIVAMTDPKYNNNTEVFQWDKKTQNTVTSMFFFGYFLMMVPTGMLAQRFGGKLPLVVCLPVCGIMSFLFPTLTKLGNWYTACIVRFVLGMATAGVLPSLHNMIGKWYPLQERGRATAYIHTGGQFGKVIMMAFSGYLCATTIGWPMVFYVTGLIAFTGFFLVVIFGAASPDKHSTISKTEFDYIKRTCGSNEGGHAYLPTPWRKMLTSVPFLVASLAQAGFIWNLNTIMMEIPVYMNFILDVNIKNNGLLNAGPYLLMCGMAFGFSNLFDFLIKRHKLSVTTARKISNTIGTWISGAFLVAFSFVPADQITPAIILLFLSLGAKGAAHSGYLVVLTDIAPNFSGNTLSASVTFGNFLGALTPLVNGALMADVHDIAGWRYVFGLSAGLMFIVNLLFLIFGTSKVQEWNKY